MREKEKVILDLVNPHAAGIDIGSRSHWVAVGQKAEDIKEFGVYNEDHRALISWLQERGVTSIAMESTGTYWQNLFSALIAAGFEVILVNGNQTKNNKGRKTDILDCQYIQQMHSIGFLCGSFLPDSTTEIIRTYSRHRQNKLRQSANTILKVQKYLRLMNMRLDVVVNDITGETGTKIITAFISGEKSGEKLSEHRHYNCRKSKEEIAKALEYNGRDDYMFALKQEWTTYLHHQKQLEEIDQQISKLLTDIIDKDDNKKQHIAEKKPHKRRNKNTIKGSDMNQIAYQYFEGVDLMTIEGVNDATIMSIISEVGLEGIKKFETSKQFTSWLRLAPNNKISGGKVLSHHIPKGSSRLKIAFRNAANSIGNLKEGYLSDFFRRINYKRGRVAAINATARKLAVIIWNMLVKGMPYSPPLQYLFLDQKRKMKLISNIKRNIAKFDLQPEDVGFCNTLNMSC
ncbi:IS110 family transposase [Patescibacteria group bacterium]|nr:IS110 family transposase [Patescibacteria group bacterium]